MYITFTSPYEATYRDDALQEIPYKVLDIRPSKNNF